MAGLEKTSIQIDFLPGIPPDDLYKRMKFWESCRPWLLDKGYNLFNVDICSPGAFVCTMVPCDLDTVGCGHDLPYAYHERGPDERKQLTACCEGRAVFAQDDHRRHVVLKLVPSDSDELCIYQLILREQRSGNYTGGHIPGIVPILDVLEFGGHWLAVMPRWDNNIPPAWFSTVNTVFAFLRDLLRGLAFLHSHRIIHRDLQPRNYLVNHILVCNSFDLTPTMRRDLMREGKLEYVIMDFDISLILPPTISRLSYKHTQWGPAYPPPDVAQGEYDYDPFAFDIAVLGTNLCRMFQHLAPIVPALAPLLDKMVTRDIQARFTAVEALAFLEDRYAEMKWYEQMAGAPKRDPSKMSYAVLATPCEELDRWTDLPPDFVEKWAHLRMVTKVPKKVRVLRAICRYRPLAYVVRSLRRVGVIGSGV